MEQQIEIPDEQNQELQIDNNRLNNNNIENPQTIMSLKFILWRFTNTTLFTDILFLALLINFTTDNYINNGNHNLVLSCISMKISFWFVFLIKRFIQVFIDVYNLGKSLNKTELISITLSNSYFLKSLKAFFVILSIFPDVVIVSNFLSLKKNCEFSFGLCVILRIYSIITMISYIMIIVFLLICVIAIFYPDIIKKINEYEYLKNFSKLQHTIISATDENKDCPICFDNMDNALCLPCGHKFHEDCITGWIKEKGSCPTCSQKVFDKDTKDLHTYPKPTDSNI